MVWNNLPDALAGDLDVVHRGGEFGHAGGTGVGGGACFGGERFRVAGVAGVAVVCLRVGRVSWRYGRWRMPGRKRSRRRAGWWSYLFGGAEEFTCAAGLSGEDGFQGADNAGGDESGNGEGEDDDAQAEEQDDSTGIVGDLDRAAEFVVDVVAISRALAMV